MNRGSVSNILRSLGLLHLVDLIRFHIMKYRNKKANQAFIKKNPNVPLPPDYLMYESFQINYHKYFKDGLKTAEWLKDHLSNHLELKNLKILDWGCGPGRIIRHLPKIINDGCQFYGTDYNTDSIKWCSSNLEGITFNHNTLDAQTAYSNEYFDIIYGISVFTHLSEKLHEDWFKELYRILKPNGIMFLTTQGDHFKSKLSPKELEQYNMGQLVVRGNVKEGHRTYSAFHPKDYMHSLFKKVYILDHIQRKQEKGKQPPQDVWVVKKLTESH